MQKFRTNRLKMIIKEEAVRYPLYYYINNNDKRKLFITDHAINF